eukprot:scaffold6620_cov110-Isochrysis_galbana.AAC.7
MSAFRQSGGVVGQAALYREGDLGKGYIGKGRRGWGGGGCCCGGELGEFAAASSMRAVGSIVAVRGGMWMACEV